LVFVSTIILYFRMKYLDDRRLKTDLARGIHAFSNLQLDEEDLMSPRG